MTAISDMTAKVLEALKVASSYSTQVQGFVEGTVQKLLNDYNFPKTKALEVYPDITLTETTLLQPLWMKKPLGLRMYKVSDDGTAYWSEPLRRIEGFRLPGSLGYPTYYWILDDYIYLNEALSEEGYDLYFWYQSNDRVTYQDWMLANFEDAIYYLSVCRAAPAVRKPDVLELYSPLWADERQSLAIFTNELEFQDLDLEMRSDVDRRRSERYPYTTLIGAVG